MAGANRIIIPEFPHAPKEVDPGNEEDFRKLVRDGFAGVEEYVTRVMEETLPRTAMLTSNVGIGTTTFETFLSLRVLQTGYYSVEGFLKYYATTADDFQLKLLYNDTGAGAIVYDLSTHYELATGEGVGFVGAGQSSDRHLAMHGYLDIQSVATNPVLDWQMRLNTDSGSTAIAWAGSWIRIQRLDDT